MTALVSFFAVMVVSLVILRIATIILKFTGISEDIARFQARSAFTGTGFTSRETEVIVNHPLRRKIIMFLMMVRNVGFVTLVTSLILSFFTSTTTEDFIIRILFLCGGLFMIYILSKIRILDKILSRIVEAALKRMTKIYIYDYESLLNLAGEFSVISCKIGDGNWCANRSLTDLKLPDEGILILGIKRPDGYYIGTPQGKTVILPDDEVILYGREELLLKISHRPQGEAGQKEHERFVDEQRMREGRPAEKKEEQKHTVIDNIKRFFSRK
ncbi:MAG: potassium transporter TrkA [Spirochaetales bacterium]|nr:potassium transporter TrkA [Spirochaetales bacterium]